LFSDINKLYLTKSKSVPPAGALGETNVRLPLGGMASTDPGRIRGPWVRPFWLLVAMVGAALSLYLWVRVAWL
jgi:hypothetical protein